MRRSPGHECASGESEIYALWALKEADLKGCGSVPPRRISCSFSADVTDRPEGWYFDRYTPGSEHVVAWRCGIHTPQH